MDGTITKMLIEKTKKLTDMVIVKRSFLGQEKPHRLRLENALFTGLVVHNLNVHAVRAFRFATR